MQPQPENSLCLSTEVYSRAIRRQGRYVLAFCGIQLSVLRKDALSFKYYKKTVLDFD